MDTLQKELAQVRQPHQLMTLIGRKAREITGADGTTFVMRDGEHCYYAAEDAISPLWKGQRFHMRMCISGWVMLNNVPASIDDIYMDTRIPADAYRMTFVKSLAMVPVGNPAPVAAIGAYWAKHRGATPQRIEALETLAGLVAEVLEKATLLKDLRTHTAVAAS